MSIPDKETVELMQQFYQHKLSGEPTYESFYKAQGYMRNKYPNMPYYWAAFTLIE